MKVVVRFFAALRELIGKKVVSLEFLDSEEINVEKVFKRLKKLYKDKFIQYVFDEKTGEVKDYLTLLVNGRNITALNEMRTRLMDGDVLAILPPVGGG